MKRPRSTLGRRMAALAAAAAILLLSVVGCAMTGSTEAAGQLSGGQAAIASAPTGAQSTGSDLEKRKTPTPTPRPRQTPKATPTRAGPTRVDGLLVIYVDQLPREARDTLRLIERGGPFPFDKDGVTFQNREGILPSRPRGYYHEYTVITPGENDRGARRIVTGSRGELYYTDDHYDSFKRVLQR
ncbi:MAG: ribonuclease domain-containing protein [Caldilineaceae bacterium]